MKTWTLLDDARILSLFSKGWTRKQIAADFGVTRNAICGKIHRLVYRPPPELTMQDDQPTEISFVDVLLAEPVFEPPAVEIVPRPTPDGWYVGQHVIVDYARAWSRETDFVDWRGSGVIDMIAHAGHYIRVRDEGFYAWIAKENFRNVHDATYNRS